MSHIHMLEDAHQAIHNLMKQNELLRKERDAAVEDIRLLGRTGEFICPVCAHYNHGEGTTGECVKCLTGDGFRWRGEKDGGTDK